MSVQLFFFGVVDLTAAATARSVYDLVTDSALDAPLPENLTGQCVSLNITADVDIKIGGSAAELDDTHGGTLTATYPFTDSASGVAGNSIPISQIFLYSPTASGTATVTIYLRFIG